MLRSSPFTPRAGVAAPAALLAATLAGSIALSFGGLAQRAAAQDAPNATGAPTLEQRLARLCEDLDQRRRDLNISGLSLAVVKDDRVILARGFGLRDREQKIAADADTLYGIGSTSKAFTSMLCAMLADEGKLSFDDKPAKFLPWFKFKDPEADANATLRDLLSHRTGLTRNDVAWIGTEATREDLLRAVAETDRNAPYKKAWQYNNNMYLCAGECAAAVAGKSWDELVAQRIFAPLGMKRSVTSTPAALADPRLSRRYDWDATKKEFQPVDWMVVDNMAPAGAICSTVTDMAQWVRFLLKRGEYGGQRLVADVRFDELWKDDDELEPSYGLGWFLHEKDPQKWRDPAGKDHRVVEHGGNVAGYAAEVGLLPDLGLGLVMLSNTSATQLQAGILPLVFDAIAGPWKERRPVAEGKVLTEEETKKWVGAYTERRPGVPNRALIWSTDHLVLVLPRMPGQTSDAFFTLLWPGEDGRAWIREEPTSYVTFERTEDGKLAALTLVQGDLARRLTPFATPEPPRAPDLTLDELMELRAKASGIEAASGWKSLRLTGTLAFPMAGVKGRYVVTAAGTGRLRIDYDAGRFGHTRTIVTGEKGSFVAHFASAPVMPPARAATLAFANPLVEHGNWLDQAEDVELTSISMTSALGIALDKACYAVKVKPFGADPLTYYIALEDHRLVFVEGPTAFAGSPQAIPLAKLSDWRDVKGVQFPFHREMAIPDIGKLVVQFDKADVDVDLPPDFFALPPPAGSDPKPAGS